MLSFSTEILVRKKRMDDEDLLTFSEISTNQNHAKKTTFKTFSKRKSYEILQSAQRRLHNGLKEKYKREQEFAEQGTLGGDGSSRS